MRIVGAHHVAILTPNLARLRAFYTERLGLPVVGGFAGYGIIFIAAGNTTIELEEQGLEEHRAVPGNGSGWHHLALEVDDVDAAYAELSGQGIPFDGPPQDFPPGAPSLRIAFFADPDGNTLELVQPLARRQWPAGTVSPME
jgi:glyoxylase I family protein